MKTKLLKFGMPVMAFLVAIVFAFATENNPQPREALVTGYIFQNNDCVPTQHDCQISGTQLCTVGANTVYMTKSGTVCLNPLRRP